MTILPARARGQLLRRAGDAARDPQAVERDRLIYNAIGFMAGCLIAIMFFRRVSFMIIAAARR